jgi:hypothetical protein
VVYSYTEVRYYAKGKGFALAKFYDACACSSRERIAGPTALWKEKCY